jgi:hypothetical protein
MLLKTVQKSLRRKKPVWFYDETVLNATGIEHQDKGSVFGD